MSLSHDIAHEMGRGADINMQVMVRDMRNHFWRGSTLRQRRPFPRVGNENFHMQPLTSANSPRTA